jgi:phosphohistidine phosphatase
MRPETCQRPGMDLYVIRHAIAQEARDDLPDTERELTRKGRRRFRDVVRGLDAHGVELDRVLYSPWKRAAETAHLLSPIIADRRRDALVATDALTASPNQHLLDLMFAHSAAGTVGVVGHEPWLSELIALLVFGDTLKRTAFELKKGSVAHLEGDATVGGMVLLSLIPPKVLRH